MKIINVNLNGIRRAVERGFLEWLQQQDADVICVQNLQARSYELDDSILYPQGYEGYFFDADKENFSGTGVYCRKLPKAIMTGLGFEQSDFEGRYIQADFDKVSIGSFLMPDNSSPQEKYAFMEHFNEYLKKLRRKRREYIICGSWYTAHKTIDLADWANNQDTPGFRPVERAWLDQVFGPMGFLDAFREVNREENQFSWYPDLDQPKNRQDGWRIDYQVTGPNMRRNIVNAWFDTQANFSEHVPLVIEYDLEL